MADQQKSLSTIASELWHGFGNNPRNVETFDALANVNPIMAAYRGAKTLGNTDYGALRDLLLSKYQIADNPRAELQREGKALGNVTMGLADVVPMAPVAAAGMKAAAPSLAKEALKLTEKYGISPTMHVVPPEGNLNLRPAIEEGKIKGPEKQRAGDMLRQLKDKPGITKEGLSEIRQKIIAEHGSTNKVMTKKEFESFVEPSKYEKVDLKNASEGDIDHYMQEAEAQMDPEQAVQHLGVPRYYTNDALMLSYRDVHFQELDPDSQRILGRIFGIDKSMTPDEIQNTVEDAIMGAYHEVVYDRAEMLRDANDTLAATYPYQGVQRLVHSQPDSSYFEFGVTHPNQTEAYRHYSSDEAPEGLIGHVRGSHMVHPGAIEGGVEVPANSYVVEEIQSDAQKKAQQTGHLSQVHGTLAKAAIQDAIERGADRIYFPTSHPIGVTRGRPAEDYASIYDQAVHKEALNPISEKYGVQLEPQMSKYLDKNSNALEVPFYHKLELTPELKQRLELEGQQTPGYKKGGEVKADYNDEHIDKLSNKLLQGEYGLRVTGEPKGKGALGEIRMPDGQTVMTEYSINPQGQGEMPSIVEGMHPADLNYLREYAARADQGEDPGEFPSGVEAVAKRSAQRRKAEGKPAFYGEGGEVKDPFANLGIVDKAALLAKAIKYRIQYNKQAEEHGKYPDVLAAALKEKYREPLGNSRVNRSPLDAAINYGGGYDFGVRGDIPANVARDMAKAYQYTDYFFSPFTGPKSDAVGDYHENMAGVEAGIKERGHRASEAEIQRRSAEYGRKTSSMLPQNEEENYAHGGLVYNDETIDQLANQLLGV